MRALATLVGIALLPAFTSSQPLEPCGSSSPARGPVPGVADARFGEATTFWNEGPGGVQCRLLVASGVERGYVARYHVVKGRLFAFRCVGASSAFVLPEGQRYGLVRWELSRLEASGLHPASIPGWSLVSSPSFCGPYVAYWHVDAARVSAAIYDLLQERVASIAPTNIPDPHTDNPYHFPVPHWNAAEARADFSVDGSPELLVSLKPTK